MHGLYANTNPFYTKDLRILRSWYSQGSEQSPMDSEGKLYCISLQEAYYIVESKGNCVCNFNSLWGKSKSRNPWILIHSWRILSFNLGTSENDFQMECYPSESWKRISDHFSQTLCREKKKDTLYKRERVYEDLEKKGRRAYLIDCNNLELRMRVTQMRKEARLDK